MVKDKVRLDRCIAYLTSLKRDEVKRLIQEEDVLVNNRIVKTNAFIKDEDIVSFKYDDYYFVFKVKLEFKDNKILLGIEVLKKEEVKYYSC